MSPTSRRRRGEPTLDEAAADAGTRFADVADTEPTDSPAEPEWLRDVPAVRFFEVLGLLPKVPVEQ